MSVEQRCCRSEVRALVSSKDVLSFDVFDALHKLLKPPDTLVQSSNDLVAVTARNCANLVDDSGLKIDECFFPFLGHSTSPLYRQGASDLFHYFSRVEPLHGAARHSRAPVPLVRYRCEFGLTLAEAAESD